MRAIVFYFQVHQPFRLKQYRFFEIGQDHYYYNEFANRSIMRKVAEKCYLPMNQLLLDLINKLGDKFKVAFSISGTAIDQFELYAPEVLESFKKLAQTGNVEFLDETYAHSLAALKSKTEFIRQVNMHRQKIKELFDQEPTVFRNTELIYSDDIAKIVADLGYKAMLTEGAKHILGWRTPNFLYYSGAVPKLKLLLKNYQLSDDIAFRFSNRAWDQWPLTAEKYVSWLSAIDKKQEIINLFMDYETFGEHQWAETGIFDFFRALPFFVLENTDFQFMTPSEVIQKFQPVAPIHVPHPISWADEARDLTAWLGNELQREAFDKLYSLEHKVYACNDSKIWQDWLYLQTSDHFYYMCTKFFSDGDVHKYFNPYNTPYDAFINYMNILSDFSMLLDSKLYTQFGDKEPVTEQEILNLINKYQAEIDRLKKKLETIAKIKQQKISPQQQTSTKTSRKKRASTKSTKTSSKSKASTKTQTQKKSSTKTSTSKKTSTRKTTTKKTQNKKASNKPGKTASK